MSTLTLKVAQARPETASIRRLTLESADGAPLPGFEPGAHITLQVPDVGVRKYSLVNGIATADAAVAPRSYCLGVRLEAEGGGGSRFIHGLAVGDRVECQPPQNNFALAAGSAPVALVAGGIGVTPLISMAASMRAVGRPFRMIYAARARSEFAFLDEIRPLAGDELHLHADDEAGGVFDTAAFFAGLPAETRVYACGPRPMLKACMAAARSLGWPRDRLAFELFYSVAP